MDPKELKTLLKEAKEGIKSKDFATTIKNCKTILKKEPDHYQANLYLGTAMKEQGKWQQAIECYKKATEIDPKQVYAWQGIILVYEKQGIKAHNDLLDAYKRIATFFEKDDKQKYIESTKKLAYVLISQQENKSALKVITGLAKSVGVDIEMAGVIVQLLSQTKWDTRTPDQNQLYTSALETIVTESPQPPEETCKKYFTQVNRSGDYGQVISQAVAMKDRWNMYHSPMEWICRYFIEDRIDSSSLEKIGPMDVLTEKLFKLYPSSSYGHFARGKFLVDGELKMNEGFGFLRTGLESTYNLYALLILVQGRLKFGDFEGTVEDCQLGLREFDKNQVAVKNLSLYALEANIWLDTEKATENLTKLKQEFQNEEAIFKDRLLILEAKLCIRKLDFESLGKVFLEIEKANIVDWKVEYYRVILNADCENPESVQSVIDSYILLNPQNIELMISATIILFDLKRYERSGEILLKVTETPQGSTLPLPWKYLGLLYSLQENLRLAAKCFRKSYDLCQSTDVGALLSDAYFAIVEEKWNKELLIDATKSFTKSMSKWAWLRLGILYLNSGDANEAVNAFQAAIRADINDCHVWESLADAYFMRGSYSAALNTYNKALSLGAAPMHPRLKIGVVYQCLTQHDDSISSFNALLKDYPDNTPVLVELARTYSLIAQEKSTENFDTGALRSVEDALVYAVHAIKTSTIRILLPWKIIGDAPLILSNIPEDVMIKVPDFLLGEPQTGDSLECMKFKEVDFDKFKEIGTRALLECLQVINSEESGADYSKAIAAYIYHQLALSYFNRARTPRGQTKYPDFFKKSLVCVKKALAANPGNHMYWNTLGVVSFFCGGSDELAQHGFIKSLDLETNNVVAWCNLGVLYLKHKKDRLAHQAFAKAQSVAPLHSPSWIGQGLVAETLAPKEAPDLFRHAAHLEPNPFAVSCYADWVCRLLLDDVFGEEDYWFTIIRVDAVTIVNDLMTRVERRLQSPHLFNMKGITAAFNGFYETALESFTTALELCSVPDSLFPVSEQEIKHILFNRVTILGKMGLYEEAREQLSTVEELGTVGFLNAALALAKLGDLENSEQLYLQLEDRLETEGNKVDLKIAVAMIASMAQRPDVACTLLNDKSMTKNPHAILALSAMGVLSSNVSLVGKSMKRLEKLLEKEEFVADVGLMKACFQIMKGSTRSGVNELLKLLRMYPENRRLWSLTSQMLYRYQLSVIPASALRNVTLKALRLSTAKGKLGDQNSLTSKSSAMISLSYLIGGDWKSAIRTALKGIRKYPEVRENWVVLACGLWHQFVEQRSGEVYDKIVRMLEKELVLNRVSLRAQAWIGQFLKLIQQYKISL